MVIVCLRVYGHGLKKKKKTAIMLSCCPGILFRQQFQRRKKNVPMQIKRFSRLFSVSLFIFRAVPIFDKLVCCCAVRFLQQLFFLRSRSRFYPRNVQILLPVFQWTLTVLFYLCGSRWTVRINISSNQICWAFIQRHNMGTTLNSCSEWSY